MQRRMSILVYILGFLASIYVPVFGTLEVLRPLPAPLQGIKGSFSLDGSLILGGVGSDGKAVRTLYQYNFDNNSYAELPSFFCDIESHSVSEINEKLWVYGGNRTNCRLPLYLRNNMFAYDVYNSKWSTYSVSVNSVESPPNFEDHTSGIYHNFTEGLTFHLVLFGGKISGTNSLSSDLWITSVEEVDLELNVAQWSKITVIDNSPAPRYAHASVMYGDDLMYIYGGIDAQGKVLEDLWAFNFLESEWSFLSNQGDPRAFHEMVVSDDHVCVIGGVQNLNNYAACFDTRSEKWTVTLPAPETNNVTKPPYDDMLVTQAFDSDTFLFFGGRKQPSALEDLQNGVSPQALSFSTTFGKITDCTQPPDPQDDPSDLQWGATANNLTSITVLYDKVPDYVNLDGAFSVTYCLVSFPTPDEGDLTPGVKQVTQCVTLDHYYYTYFNFLIDTVTSGCRRHLNVYYETKCGKGEVNEYFFGCFRKCSRACRALGSQPAPNWPQLETEVVNSTTTIDYI